MAPFPAARILIVDDQEPNLHLLRAMLAHDGYTDVVATTEPAGVLALVQSQQPDVVLLDLHMPGMDGYAVLAALRASGGDKQFLPVIVLTADMTPEAKRRALSLGANDFLAKPFDIQEVLLRIGNLLEMRSLHLNQLRQNELLETRVAERTSELAGAQVEILDRLARAADFRDDVTGQHARRVGVNAAALASALDLPAGEVEAYRLAAPLHDIGKIGVPDAILLKPGPLTAEEFDVIRRHATIGAEILSGSHFRILQLAEEVARFHHERWDGRGYAGLAGPGIPLGGRVVAVADVFDALVHERPYKEAWPADRVIAQILSDRGKAFEPRIVDVFADLFRAGEVI